ncbi:METTL22 [Lepeophtheirus salmonis]|uniref:METTL22 n=1 Tax=Lepeophtheirus salmonis TaxID=72036 RepID=A0A7R8CQ88_LEPSM|nr:METTL22 [Lepeophtheirus salmonis]CAF2893066.1 METTL22 [Lepeophtheirus salmonis]
MEQEVRSEIYDDNFLNSLSFNVFNDEDDEGEMSSDHHRRSNFDFTNKSGEFLSLEICHYVSSSVDLVGLQVWRGALLLSDYILDNQDYFKHKCTLELAAGTGIASIVSGLFADEVYITDVDRGQILDIINMNVKNNKHLIKSKDLHVQELDLFFNHSSWSSDVSPDIILAADMVYDPKITLAFFQTLRYLLVKSPATTVLFALEKRNRTNENSEVVAPNYQIFMNYLVELQKDCPYLSLESIEIKLFKVLSSLRKNK